MTLTAAMKKLSKSCESIQIIDFVNVKFAQNHVNQLIVLTVAMNILQKTVTTLDVTDFFDSEYYGAGIVRAQGGKLEIVNTSEYNNSSY